MNGKKREARFTRDRPIFARKVLQIVRMREKGATFDEIAEQVGGTRMGAWYQYQRWQDWGRAELAREQRKNK